MKAKRFVAGAVTSAILWAGTWMGAGYLIGGAIRDGDGSRVRFLAAIVAVSVTLLSLIFGLVMRATVTIWLSRRGGECVPMTKLRPANTDVAAGRPKGSRQWGGAVMDVNEYELEVLVRDRITDLGRQSQRVRGVRPVFRSLRIVLGRALIRMGRRLQNVHRPSRSDRSGWQGQPTLSGPDREG